MKAKRQVGGRYVAWMRGAFRRDGKQLTVKVQGPKPCRA